MENKSQTTQQDNSIQPGFSCFCDNKTNNPQKSFHPALRPEQANIPTFKFSAPGAIHLYAVHDFFMGVAK